MSAPHRLDADARRIADLLDAGRREEAQAEFTRVAQGEKLLRWQATVLADLIATKRKPLKP